MCVNYDSIIRKAVIPAAGLGTRLRPLTNILAKEMLPLGSKPAVQYIIDELHGIGISDIIFVVSPSKHSIREYFGETACNGDINLHYVVQDPLNGLANAILQAESAVGGENFIVALGDTILLSKNSRSPIERLVDAYRDNPAYAAITVERIDISDANMYGMVKPVAEYTDNNFEICDLVEKPRVEESPSDFAIGGRYIFPSDIFDWIRHTPKGFGGEQQITDVLKLCISGGNRVWCAPILEGEKRYDIGSIYSYCEAFTAACIFDDDLNVCVKKAVQIIKS
ncbi:MAG: sugar phosphate nucleotidyltransferase [Armatimonadota bacterium]